MKKHIEFINKELDKLGVPFVAYLAIEEIEKAALRYEKIRKLNPHQFTQLWKTSMDNHNFDELVDKFVINESGNVIIP